MNTITLATLKAANACSDQVQLFHKTFGESADVTEANLVKAVKAGLQIAWLGRFVPENRRQAYDEAIAPAWQAYNDAKAPADRAYNDAIATATRAIADQAYAIAGADQAYAIAGADQAYEEATAHARQAYSDATAHALVAAFN